MCARECEFAPSREDHEMIMMMMNGAVESEDEIRDPHTVGHSNAGSYH